MVGGALGVVDVVLVVRRAFEMGRVTEERLVFLGQTRVERCVTARSYSVAVLLLIASLPPAGLDWVRYHLRFTWLSKYG